MTRHPIISSQEFPHRALDRRTFVRVGAACAATLVLPEKLLADPYAPFASRLGPKQPVRVQGQVRSDSRGIPGVAVTDGLAVVDTTRDGPFEIMTTADRPFISLTVPAGYAVPTNATGTARFYKAMAPDAAGEMEVIFELERLARSDESHALYLLSDPQTQDAQEMQWFHEQTVPDVQRSLNSIGEMETCGIACGDIMYDHLEFYPDYERGVSRMGIPFFQVVGNHDLDQQGRTDQASTETFSRHFGPRYYSFDRGSVHYIVLDDVFWHGAGYLGYVGRDQLRWLEADLARVEPGRTVIVALHIPTLPSRHLRYGQQQPSTGISVTNREALYRLLEPFNAHILSGHTHESEHIFEGGVHEHVNGTVCGAWWSGPICADGTPSGYGVYEIRGDEVTWQYKATGFDFDHQMRVYAHGADPKAPDEIVANVWNWDPTWTVAWYEDGERKGEMARRTGTDPLAVKLHTGPDLPPRRTWVEPLNTNHLFYAPASQGTHEVRVEAIDRFGRAYSARVGE